MFEEGWRGGAERFHLTGGVSRRKLDRRAERGRQRDTSSRVFLPNSTSGLQVRGLSVSGRFLTTHKAKAFIRLNEEREICVLNHRDTSVLS